MAAELRPGTSTRQIFRSDDVWIQVLTQSREDSLNTPGRPTRSHESHRRVLSAIRARDVEAARAAMLEHIESVESLVLDAPADRARREQPRA